jgi:hypothetical protein
MSAQEIIAELPRLKPEELRQVKASLTELEQRQKPSDRSVWDVLLDFAGKAKGLPRDLSANHDHYLYGTPKRKP